MIFKLFSYSLDKALTILCQEMDKRNFVETVEVSFRPKKETLDLPYQQMISLPNALKKRPRIAVLVSDDATEADIEKYTSAGADIVGSNELIEQIKNDNIKFDRLLTKPTTMTKLAPVGKILGRKGLMPSSKTETLIDDLESSIKEFRAGKFSIHTDKNGVINVPFGKLDYTKTQLKENLLFLHDKIKSACKNSSGNRHLKNVTISSTMSRGIKIRISDLP